MAIQFLDPSIALITAEHQHPVKRAPASSPLSESFVTTSRDVSGIELRMLPPQIKENGTARVFPFKGYARLYCLTIVISDEANQLVGAIDLKGFPRIGDNEPLPINKTIFYWQHDETNGNSPDQIHTFCSVIKSKESLRDIGKILAGIKKDEEYSSVIGSIGSLAKGAAQFNMVTDVMVQLAGLVGRYLGDVDDKPLGTVVNSYTTLYGDFDKIGINPYSHVTRNVDFNFQLIVRSQEVERQLAGQDAAEGIHPAPHQLEEKGPVLTEEHVEVDMVPL